MSKLKAGAAGTQNVAVQSWPPLNLPDPATAALSPATAAFFQQWEQSLQAWYAQVQGTMNQQLAVIASNHKSAPKSGG